MKSFYQPNAHVIFLCDYLKVLGYEFVVMFRLTYNSCLSYSSFPTYFNKLRLLKNHHDGFYDYSHLVQTSCIIYRVDIIKNVTLKKRLLNLIKEPMFGDYNGFEHIESFTLGTKSDMERLNIIRDFLLNFKDVFNGKNSVSSVTKEHLKYCFFDMLESRLEHGLIDVNEFQKHIEDEIKCRPYTLIKPINYNNILSFEFCARDKAFIKIQDTVNQFVLNQIPVIVDLFKKRYRNTNGI